MNRGQVRSLIPAAYADLKAWPAPDIEVFDDDEKQKYIQRRTAVEMYAQGARYDEIRSLTGKCDEEVRRLVRRCVISDGAGDIYGFYALLPAFRVRGYERKKMIRLGKGNGHGGYAGAMKTLLRLHPEAAVFIKERILKLHTDGYVPEARISYKNLHSDFLKMLRGLKLTDADYPFKATLIK